MCTIIFLSRNDSRANINVLVANPLRGAQKSGFKQRNYGQRLQPTNTIAGRNDYLRRPAAPA